MATPITIELTTGDDIFKQTDNSNGIIIRGREGNDTIAGGRGNDIINGNQGNDVLLGGWGNDVIHGGVGDDVLFGGQGDDVLTGSTGRDVLSGDAGSDTLIGGPGADIFSFNVRSGILGTGVDTVMDFEFGIDKIQLVNGDRSLLSVADNGANLDLFYSGTQVATILNAAGASLSNLFNDVIMV